MLRGAISLLCLIALPANYAEAQTVVKYMHVLSEIQARFATTDIVSEIENTSFESAEVVYLAELPENAFIKTFYLERDGLITHGIIKGKEDAQEEFDQARKEGKSAAHIRESNDRLFELHVSLAPRAKIGFNLTYQEVLQKKNYMYKHVINVRADAPIANLEVNVLIADKHDFDRIHIPRFENGIGSLPVEELLERPRDERVILQSARDDSGTVAYIAFDPREKMENGELVILFNSTVAANATEIQVVNGYFLHQFSPPSELEVGNKTIIFVLDKSGSMKGTKLQQMKEAMMEILDEISESDRVNIVAFDKTTTHWRDDAAVLDAESKIQAKKFVEDIVAQGGTNLATALEEGMKMLESAQQKQPSFMASILVLTDGRATVGMKEHRDILDHLETLGHNYSINSISFGNDADYLLMKKLGGRQQPGGIARRIFENSDATLQIAGFYHEIAYPLLKHIKITYLDEAVDVSSVITSGEQDFLFSGDEFFQLGKVSSDASPALFSTDVETESTEGLQIEKTEVIPSSVCIDPTLVNAVGVQPKNLLVCGRNDATIGNFIERMWAHMSVLKYERLKEAQTKSDEEKKNVADQIRRMSLKYGFVSSQTSMVVVLENNTSSDGISLEEREFEEEFLDSPIETGGSAKKLSSDLSARFKTPFISKKQVFPEKCQIHITLLVDRVFHRRISALRLARIVSDLSQTLPPDVSITIGDISANRSISILGGNEEKLFSMVEEYKATRQQLLILSEFAASLDRPFEYLSLLLPAYQRVIVAKTTGSITTTESSFLRQFTRDLILIKSPDARNLVQAIHC